MNPTVRCIAILHILLYSSLTLAQTTWTGNFSSDWGQTNNWTNGLPGPFNEPTIPLAPVGPFNPTVPIFTYFNFNVHNHGVLTIAGTGGVSLFGMFINYSGSTIILGNATANFLVESSGNFENHGTVISSGTFNNQGLFTNALGGVFNNSHVFSHTEGGFSNQGEFNNTGQFFSEDNFINAGVFNNSNLLNNNGPATNQGILNSATGATLRNDLQLVNQAGATCNINGSFLNNNSFSNFGQVTTAATAVVNNSLLIRNQSGGIWSNHGVLNNVFCAIFEAKGTQANNGQFENEGIVYGDTPILPNLPTNTGSGVVVLPNNVGILCHDFTISLNAAGTATVVGLDLANDQFNFCTGWTILVNGQSSYNFSGCASLGLHVVSVSFTDPFGRMTVCPANVTVIDNSPPVIACQQNQTVALPIGECNTAVSLEPPTVILENCTVSNINNDAPPIFQIGATLVNWTVTDQNGNTSACTSTITVVDQIPPTINCPPSKFLNCPPTICGFPSQSPEIAGDPATATDNCGTPIVSNNAPVLLPIGVNSITWAATDAYGNIANCQQNVTISDTQAPVIASCVPDMVVQAAWPNCQAVVNWGNALATDNCGAIAQQFSIPVGSVFDLGTTPVTVTVSDASQNTATCQFMVTVVDNEPPIWTNCPSDTTVHLTDCGDMATADWPTPSAFDDCSFQINSNFQIGDVLPFGQNTVVFTATDPSGNSANCTFVIHVTADLYLDCPSDMTVSVGAGATSSLVNWNAPPGTSSCQGCTSLQLNDFAYLGEKAGHRYFVYTGGQVAWAEANAIAAQNGGHLVAIADLLENDFLRKELPIAFQSVWMGLSDEIAEGQFTWSNGEALSFTNWQSGTVPQNDQLDQVLFKNDGTWADALGSELHSFLMEIPCFELDVQSSNPNALQSLNFPIGQTAIHYESTDICGHTCSCGFTITVMENQQFAPCLAQGNSDFGWIETVQTEGFVNTSGNDGGRGDFSSSVFKMPDPGCVLRLSPGGPAASNYLYWRVWADLNKDGDYFDDQELLGQFEGVGEQDFCYDVAANLPTGPIGLRIAMSRWDYAAVCGNFLAGEAEDYLVNFIDSSLFSPDSCHWFFENLAASVDGLKAKLEWQGMGTCDVAHFIVEKSPDGSDFMEIADLAAQTPLNQPIAFWDKTPFYGNNFYRIKATLADSTEEISNPVALFYENTVETVMVYPNPAQDELIVHYKPIANVPARVFIADAKGQLLQDRFYQALENEPLSFDLTGYASGIYTLYLKPDGHKEQVVRFVVGLE